MSLYRTIARLTVWLRAVWDFKALHYQITNLQNLIYVHHPHHVHLLLVAVFYSYPIIYKF